MCNKNAARFPGVLLQAGYRIHPSPLDTANRSICPIREIEQFPQSGKTNIKISIPQQKKVRKHFRASLARVSLTQGSLISAFDLHIASSSHMFGAYPRHSMDAFSNSSDFICIPILVRIRFRAAPSFFLSAMYALCQRFWDSFNKKNSMLPLFRPVNSKKTLDTQHFPPPLGQEWLYKRPLLARPDPPFAIRCNHPGLS